jgi:hypothetical protein
MVVTKTNFPRSHKRKKNDNCHIIAKDESLCINDRPLEIVRTIKVGFGDGMEVRAEKMSPKQ